uniref:Solute carrier family 18 member B1 n=1 Tax=Callorhinchus milii TaxID=7868 RepID=A0A4W3JBL7_CALMI
EIVYFAVINTFSNQNTQDIAERSDIDLQHENPRESTKMTRYQIFTLVSSASVNFSSMICYSILGPFFPKEAENKGVSDTIVGMIFGCFAFFNLVSSLILGKYIVQIGAKFLFVVGMLVSGCCTILFGLLNRAPDGGIFIALCFIIRSVDAIGFAGSMTASFSILARAFPENVATVMGCMEIFSGLGLVLGPPFGGFLYQSFGYEVPFIVLGCLVLLMVPLNIWILPSYDGIRSTKAFWTLLALPKVFFVVLIIFSISSCIGFLDPTMSLFVIAKFNFPVGRVGLVYVGFALSYALSSPLLGFVSDRIPRARKWLIVIGSWLTSISFLFLGPIPIFHIKSEIWMFISMLILTGFSLGMCGIPTFPEIINCAYENGFEEGLGTLGLVSGIFGAFWSLGTFIGPTLGGFLYEKFDFEWAAAIQGSLPFVKYLETFLHYGITIRLISLSLGYNCTAEESKQLLK